MGAATLMPDLPCYFFGASAIEIENPNLSTLGPQTPGDGAPGSADSLNTVHGGIGSKNKNAPPPIP